MIAVRSLVTIGIGILIAASTGSVFATPFTPVLDELWIEKDGTEIFRDSFADGTPPPSGPDGSTTYSMFGPGGITSETGDKLTMTPSLGDITVITAAKADVSTAGLRILSTNPANNNFLGQDSAFEIHGLYDMSNLPMIPGQSFGIRAIDRALGIDNKGDNTLYLLVGIHPVTLDLVVTLRLVDFENDSTSVLGSDVIESLVSGADQIELILSKVAGSSLVSASYSIYDTDGIELGLGTGNLAEAQGTIYIGEDYIRAQFISTDRIPVPEPTTLALMGLGLAGIGYRRQRSKKAA
jgi:hypothetical protein